MARRAPTELSLALELSWGVSRATMRPLVNAQACSNRKLECLRNLAILRRDRGRMIETILE